MSVQFVAGTKLATEECCNCHVLFAMPAELQERLRKSQANFYCPAGHPQHYTGPTPEQKLRDELARKDAMLEAAEARAAKVRVERDQVCKAHSRMRARVMNGVCPCCNRTFQNLMAHMRTEHAGELKLSNVRQAFGMTQDDVARETGVTPSQVSAFERGRPVSAWAGSRLETWLEGQAARHV